MAPPTTDPVIIIGHGIAGLVAAFELTKRNVPCIFVDQENANNVGGQAFWSLGGLFLVDSVEQRRMGIRDSHALALRDWLGSANFDRLDGEDRWPRRWAEAFVDWAAGGMEKYVKDVGIGFLFNVGWAERGDGTASGHGNSVPRFHLTWGTGPEIVRRFLDPVREAEKKGLVQFRFRHRVDELIIEDGRAVGIKGGILEPDDSPRGRPSSRKVIDSFELRGPAVLVAAGGIGGNVDLVKANWPLDRLGPKVPDSFVIGVPHHVDGRMLGITETAGAHIVNRDRMWHYTEGLQNYAPIWPGHGIRVLPAPSSLWLDATGQRMPPFLFPGSDTLATLKHICATEYDYSWFILTQDIIAKEFALSGSEQNPDVTGKSIWQLLRNRIFSSKGTENVQAFVKRGADFVVRENLADLVVAMNELAAERSGPALDYASVLTIVEARDGQFDNAYSKDAQAMLIANGREYLPDAISRIAKPHKLLDPKHGPLIAVRMNLLTRKTLGGVETNLKSQAMHGESETVFPGLYAAGEIAGFGGGGVHGYSSLEGTFLGGCIFSGRAAGMAMADEVLGTAA